MTTTTQEDKMIDRADYDAEGLAQLEKLEKKTFNRASRDDLVKKGYEYYESMSDYEGLAHAGGQDIRDNANILHPLDDEDNAELNCGRKGTVRELRQYLRQEDENLAQDLYENQFVPLRVLHICKSLERAFYKLPYEVKFSLENVEDDASDLHHCFGRILKTLENETDQRIIDYANKFFDEAKELHKD